MQNKLQRILFGAPAIVVACLFALYLLGGFFVLPAVVKRQIETQVPEQIGHRVSVERVRFNPLAFSLEVDNFTLSDPQGRLMVGARRLMVDFELRSVIVGAWTFSSAVLDAPALYIDLDRDGRHNFSALFDRLSADRPDKEAGGLPRVIVDRLVLNSGQIEYSDRLLDEPLVARIESLHMEIDKLSTVPSQKARYRLSARTVAGEAIETSGDLTLDPIIAKGKLNLNGVKVATLARGLSRLVALDSPAGQIDLAANFNLAVGPSGAVSGTAQDIGLDVAALSINAPGASQPLVAVESLSAQGGRVDLDRRSATFGRLRIAKGTVAAVLDEQGRIDWATIARVPAAPPKDEPTLATEPVSGVGSWQLSVASAELSDIALAFSDAAHRRSANVASIRLSLSAAAEIGASGTRIELDDTKLSVADAALRLASDTVEAQGASAELGRVSAVSLGAKSLVVTMGDGPIDVKGDGLNATLADAVVRSPADATELLRLGTATLTGGALGLKDRTVTVEKLRLANGAVVTLLDGQGRFNWSSLFGAESSPTPAELSTSVPDPAPELRVAQAPANTWRLALKSCELDGFAVGFEDRRESPAFAIGLKGMHARVKGLDTGSVSPIQVEVRAQVASGGQIGVNGTVRVDNGMSDLKVKLTGIALAPVQTYLSGLADLRLASGTVSTEGRLRYGANARAGAKLAYEGSVAVDGVLLEEVESEQPFLAWESVASSDVVLTLEPNRFDIGELRIERPVGSLIIASDQSVNLMAVLKRPSGSEAAAGANDGEQVDKTSVAPAQSDNALFPVTIARVRVSGGTLEFADLSLRPQFGARMHELTGVISGLGTEASSRAKLQLDARVDNYGSAKIRGQIGLHRPEQFTEIDMTFRNLEMTSLSPYVAKFAGYQIAAGRLALDLQYKVRDSKLRGENKIVLNQVELGEKVESPDALDLPLELAIAVLKDSKGVIDVGLPVSGDLNDPRFDYGAVIGKALGNLLGGIVTAPFRALGALFGVGDKKLGSIDFEPGSDVIAPPERQKLETLARALKERTNLSLVVPPTYGAEQDMPVLKSVAVRTEIVRRMGIELSAGEDPGPVDTANPRVQRAVEAVFNARYAPEVFPALRQRAVAATPSVGASVAQRGETASALPSAQGRVDESAATPPVANSTEALPAFYQGLVDRLIDLEPVSDLALAQLAARRGAAVVRELTTVMGAPTARVTLGESRNATDADDKAVTLRLQLEVAK